MIFLPLILSTNEILLSFVNSFTHICIIIIYVLFFIIYYIYYICIIFFLTCKIKLNFRIKYKSTTIERNLKNISSKIEQHNDQTHFNFQFVVHVLRPPTHARLSRSARGERGGATHPSNGHVTELSRHLARFLSPVTRPLEFLTRGEP